MLGNFIGGHFEIQNGFKYSQIPKLPPIPGIPLWFNLIDFLPYIVEGLLISYQTFKAAGLIE